MGTARVISSKWQKACLDKIIESILLINLILLWRYTCVIKCSTGKNSQRPSETPHPGREDLGRARSFCLPDGWCRGPSVWIQNCSLSDSANVIVIFFQFRLQEMKSRPIIPTNILTFPCLRNKIADGDGRPIQSQYIDTTIMLRDRFVYVIPSPERTPISCKVWKRGRGLN
jgi:hypothetical protein